MRKLLKVLLITINSDGNLDQIFILKINKPTDLVDEKIGTDNKYGILIPTFNNDAEYIEDVNYQYNDKQLLKEVISRKNPITSYVWSYENSYPVIKAEGIDNESLCSAVNQALVSTGYSSIEDLLNSITNLPSSAWNTFNQNLRTKTPKAFITTYTYKPLFGVSSSTDPNGKTTYYEYDSLGRLTDIRDNNLNIIKHYDYHYKQ